jgi:hypothetical protein
MSHKYRKPKPISEGTLVLRTESKEKYEALLASYREKCNPDGPIENDLVDEMVAAKWQQRRVASMIAALIDVSMDRMQKEICAEFQNIDNAVRTALAFDNQAKQSATLALLNRYANRHARDYHRALKQLREIQSERPPEEKSQNEPKPDLTPEPSTTSDQSCGAGPRPAAGSQPAETPATGHDDPQPPSDERATNDPLATDHCEAILQNEPNSDLTPESSTISEREATVPERAPETELATSHQPLATTDALATRHAPLATPTGHRPLATDHCSSERVV